MTRILRLATAVHRRTNAVATGITATLLLVVVLQPGAAAASSVTVSMDIGGMTYWNDATQLGDPPCPLTPSPVLEREFNGTTGSVGAFISNLVLPQGARITNLKVVARDNDTDNGLHAYLVRKRLAPKTGTDGFGGYKVLASASTSTAGANNGISRAGTTSISSAVVDDTSFAYMAEIVNCADTVDAIGVQVTYTK